MANFLDKMLNMVGWSDPDAENSDEQIEVPVRSSEKTKANRKVVSMTNGAIGTMNILYPESFDEARSVCSCIRANEAVIVNLENMKETLGQRTVDFISGSIFALDGEIKKISSGIFLVTPSSVIIEENRGKADAKRDIEERATNPWTN